MDSLWKSIVNLGNTQLEKREAKQLKKHQDRYELQTKFLKDVDKGDQQAVQAMIDTKQIDKNDLSIAFYNCVGTDNVDMATLLMPYSKKEHQEDRLVYAAQRDPFPEQLEMLRLIGSQPRLSLQAAQDATLVAALKKNWVVVDFMFTIQPQLGATGWSAAQIRNIFSKPFKRLGRKPQVQNSPMKYLAKKSLLDSRQDLIDLIAPHISEDDKIYALKRIEKCTSKNNQYPVIDLKCFDVFLQGQTFTKHKNFLLQSVITYGQEDLVNAVLDKFPKHQFDVERLVFIENKLGLWSVDTQQKLVNALDTGNVMTLLLQSINSGNNKLFSMTMTRIHDVTNGGQAVVRAAVWNRLAYAQELLNAGIAIKTQHYNDALQWASENENPAMLELFYPHAEVGKCLKALQEADRAPQNYALLQAKIDGIELHAQIKPSHGTRQGRARKL